MSRKSVGPGWAETLPVYILAGGQSRRFPGDKARAIVDGQLQLKRLLGQLQVQGREVRVVADRSDRYRDMGIDSLVDSPAGIGPLGGLLTAVANRQSCLGEGWMLVVACDQLVWRDEWLLAFESELKSVTRSNKALLGLWRSDKPTFIPGLYQTQVLDPLQQLVDQGQSALHRLTSLIADRIVYCDPSEGHPRDYSFNSPDELKAVLDRIQQ